MDLHGPVTDLFLFPWSDLFFSPGIHTGVVHLYFGCRNEEDFLHKSQLEMLVHVSIFDSSLGLPRAGGTFRKTLSGTSFFECL